MFDDFDEFIRKYAPGPGERKIPGIHYRRGGERLNWSTPGNYKYVPTAVYIQIGAVAWTGASASSGAVSQPFGVPYYGEPLILVQVMAVSPSGAFVQTRVTSGGDAVEISWKADMPVTAIHFAWLALGGQLGLG
jgi:hypothetical protein